MAARFDEYAGRSDARFDTYAARTDARFEEFSGRMDARFEDLSRQMSTVAQTVAIGLIGAAVAMLVFAASVVLFS